MNEQYARDDIDNTFRNDCRSRLDILHVQREDLLKELNSVLVISDHNEGLVRIAAEQVKQHG